jgi:valyl-tRNA synthetase
MSILAAPGNDIPLAPERMEGYRAFANKLWNACRFVLMRLGSSPSGSDYGREELSLVDRWILSEAQSLVGKVSRALNEYRYDRASDELYHFVWHQFCDWYIEFVKPALIAGSDTEQDRSVAVSRAVLLDVLDLLLRMLHPFMPFITEELWHKLPGREGFLTDADWPSPDPELVDRDATEGVETLKGLVIKTRNLRAENRIDPGKKVPVMIKASDSSSAALVNEHTGMLGSLVRAESISIVESFKSGLVAARGVEGPFEIAIPLAGLLDLEAERKRLSAEMAKLENDIKARRKKLDNESFLKRAPAEVVEKEKTIYRELREKRDRVQATLDTFSGKGP